MNLAVIGGGPAGLRAAEVAAQQGATVHLFDAKPSVGRKFLIAGKGGLNLTHSEPLAQFASRYTSAGTQPDFWTSLLSDFDNTALRSWAADLGIETFIGTSGRVFPKEFKSAPLLRRWVERLRGLGVLFEMSHQLRSINTIDDRFSLEFKTHEGQKTLVFDAVILALGGASYPETGSTGEWVEILSHLGISITPLSPANCGWEASWNSDILEHAEGSPLKNITVTAGAKTIAGELLITRYGLEGGALYQLGSTLRRLPEPLLTIDLKPSFSVEELISKLPAHSSHIFESAVKNWKLSKPASVLFKNFIAQDPLSNSLSLARAAKSLSIPLTGPRPIAEAISSAGGVAFSELDDALMIKCLPGLFVAGEMLDWEAPTGGYLLQGCFATGTRAAKGACEFLEG